MNNSLEFSTYDQYSDGTCLWTEISGYSELKPYVDGDTVYALIYTWCFHTEITTVMMLALIMQLVSGNATTDFLMDIASSQQV